MLAAAGCTFASDLLRATRSRAYCKDCLSGRWAAVDRNSVVLSESTVLVKCPYCGRTLTAAQVGALFSSARKTHAGGRPRSKAKRCPCGQMTLKRALARGHKCVKSEPDNV
jgi:ribosomal protein S27E